jgi:hypothetical protein
MVLDGTTSVTSLKPVGLTLASAELSNSARPFVDKPGAGLQSAARVERGPEDAQSPTTTEGTEGDEVRLRVLNPYRHCLQTKSAA